MVAPGADPGAIRLAFQGAENLTLDAQGNLVLHTAGGQVIQHAPGIYQDVDGVRQPLAGGYRLASSPGATSSVPLVGFQVAAYDRSRPLIIDPGVSYSTYLGGSGGDYGYGIAVDSAGNAYVTGGTFSSNFPTTPGAFQPAGINEAFVTRLIVVATPALVLGLNQPSFHGGQILSLTATVVPGAAPATVDAYVAVQLPDGGLLFLQGDGSLTWNLQPTVRNWPISPFSGQIFAYTFTGGEPGGSYAWLAAFTQPGTLNFISPIVSAPFGFSP